MNQSSYLDIGETQKNLHDKFARLVSGELDWYESEALKILGKKRLPSLKDDQLIQQAFAKSPNDESKKILDTAHYTANVVIFLKIVRGILTPQFIDEFSEKKSPDDICIYNYRELFHDLLFDSLVLLNDFAIYVKKCEPPYGCGKNPIQHHMPLFQSLRQAIYGQVSFHSFISVERDLAISIIRQIVELRIRRAFGVLAWYQPATQSVEPLPMKLLFEQIASHKDSVDLSMPFDSLTRIYGWSNIFLHSGYKEYSWKPIFVMQYMEELCLGKRGKCNLKGGVAASKVAIDSIVSALEALHPANAEVIKCEPEAIIKDA